MVDGQGVVTIENSGTTFSNVSAQYTYGDGETLVTCSFGDVKVSVTVDSGDKFSGKFHSRRDYGVYHAKIVSKGHPACGFSIDAFKGHWKNNKGRSGPFAIWLRRQVDQIKPELDPSRKRSRDDALEFGVASERQPQKPLPKASRVELSICRPRQLAQAAGLRLFDRGEEQAAHQYLRECGFCVLTNQIHDEMLRNLKLAVDRLVLKKGFDPRKGNRQKGRWELGHDLARWGSDYMPLVDRPGVDKVLTEYWNSSDYKVHFINGIISFKGSGQQNQHIDIKKSHNVLKMSTAPALKVYFPLVDFDDQTGPTRFVPGSHKWSMAGKYPNQDWSKGVYAFCPKGSAVIMDMRTWHAGTACKTDDPRPMVGVHYCEPGFNNKKYDGAWYNYDRKAVNDTVYAQLSCRARELCSEIKK